MKIVTYGLIVILISTLFTSPLSGQNMVNQNEETYKFNPSDDSERILTALFVTIRENSYSVVVNDYIANGITLGYHVDIDLENHTYTITMYSLEEINTRRENREKVNSTNQLIFNSFPTNQNFKSHSTSTGHIEAILETEDPAQIEVAITTHELWWDYDGSFSYYNDRDKDCWAAYPTPWPWNTHWYVDTCSYTLYDRIDGGRTIVSKVESEYHNYDWGDDDEITKADHWIYLEGHHTGGTYNNYGYTHSGEDSWLLSHDYFYSAS